MVDLNIIIPSVLVAIPATIAALATLRGNKILKGNGKGNVMVMLEKLLEGQARHEVDDEVRFARIEETLHRVRLQTLPTVKPSRRG